MSNVRAPELSALRLLVAIERYGSVGQAAASEGVSQPAASKKVAHLERLLGVSLIVRSPQGSRLTPEGVAVAGWSRQILDSVDQLMGAVASMRAASTSVLRIAASMTVAEHLMPTWLFDLRTANSDLHAGLQVANSKQVQELVRRGEADIGFVESPDLDVRLKSLRIGRDRLAVVVLPTHEWAARQEPLPLADLIACPLVMREEGSGTRETLSRLLGDHAAEPLLELGSNSAVKGAVMAGVGIAVLSVLAVAGELRGGELIEVEVDGVDLERDLVAVWSSTTTLSPSARALVELARNGRAAG